MLLLLVAGTAYLRVGLLRQPLFGPHHERMNETASIARNFSERSMNIFRPEINWSGNAPGYLEEAFQAYSFSVAALYKVFGPSDLVGRGVSLVFFLASALLVFLLGRRIMGDGAALFAVFFFGIAPLGIYYSAAFQPDAMIVFWSLLAVYLFVRWAEEGPEWALWCSAIAMVLVSLMKPVNLYLGLPLLYLSWQRFGGWGFLRSWRLWAYAVLVFVPTVLWYLYAHRLGQTYGNTAGIWGEAFTKFATRDLLLDPGFYGVMATRLAVTVTTLPALVFLLVGLLLRPPKGRYVVHVWAIGFVIAVLISAGSQRAHDYYWLPMVAVAALLMGMGAEALWRGGLHIRGPMSASVARGIVVFGLCLSAVAAARTASARVYSIPPYQVPHIEFTQRLRALTEPDALVVIGNNYSRGPGVATGACCRRREADGRYLAQGSVELYQSARRGWVVNLEDWTLETMDYFQAKGAGYFATGYAEQLAGRGSFSAQMDARHRLVERNEHWAIWQLLPPAETTP